MRVDDASARYPLTIDPFVQQAKLTASDGAADDNFGFSVAVSGDTVVVGVFSDDVGANVDQGSAYVLVRTGWWVGKRKRTAKLTASDGAANDFFGRSVAVSGDTVIAWGFQRRCRRERGSGLGVRLRQAGWWLGERDSVGEPDRLGRSGVRLVRSLASLSAATR